MHKYPVDPQLKTSKKTASVVGARGYVGMELCRLLLRHPAIELTHCFASEDLSHHPLFDGRQIHCLGHDQLLDHLTDYVFLATPAETSAELAPQILARGKIVIDLSDAFRARADVEYGMAPFCGALKPATQLIANPGCYVTAVCMALIPLLKSGVIETVHAIDAKSGATGAGRKAATHLLFTEVEGECLPYRVGNHQHIPEIQRAIARYAGVQIDTHFLTHLLPVKRGIVASIYATTSASLEEITSIYDKAYAHYPLVRHGTDVATLARLQYVVGTPHTHISYALAGNKLYLISLIDNLLKGAASQAIENLNRCLDLPLAFSLGEGV